MDRASLAVLVLALAFLVADAPALAEPALPSAQSGALIEEAIRLRERGLDEEALPFLRHAAALEPNARASAQLGLGLMAVGEWQEAEETLTRALDDDDDPWIVRNRATLQVARDSIRRHLGWLVIEISPEARALHAVVLVSCIGLYVASRRLTRRLGSRE